MSKSKTIMMALLLAFRALGAPISTDSQSQVRSVIDALKAQMGAFNMLAGPSLIDGLEASLRLNGSLGAEHLAALDEKIQVGQENLNNQSSSKRKSYVGNKCSRSYQFA